MRLLLLAPPNIPATQAADLICLKSAKKAFSETNKSPICLSGPVEKDLQHLWKYKAERQAT